MKYVFRNLSVVLYSLLAIIVFFWLLLLWSIFLPPFKYSHEALKINIQDFYRENRITFDQTVILLQDKYLPHYTGYSRIMKLSGDLVEYGYGGELYGKIELSHWEKKLFTNEKIIIKEIYPYNEWCWDLVFTKSKWRTDLHLQYSPWANTNCTSERINDHRFYSRPMP